MNRLLPAHGLTGDMAETRQEFERRIERRRGEETDAAEWGPLRRGWCLGGVGFRQEVLDLIAGQLGEHHAGGLRPESAQAKAGRIPAQELKRVGWTPGEMEQSTKSAPENWSWRPGYAEKRR